MKNKSGTRTCVMHFITFVQNQFSVTVKSIRTDNGSEFNMPSYYASLGIHHQTSRVETPQQNSVVARKHMHLLNVTRALFFHSNLPKCYWSYAISHAVHLINRLSTPILNQQSPYQVLYGTPYILRFKSIWLPCICIHLVK